MVTLIRCSNCKQRLSGLNRSVLDGQVVDWCPRCGKTEHPYPGVNQIQASIEAEARGAPAKNTAPGAYVRFREPRPAGPYVDGQVLTELGEGVVDVVNTSTGEIFPVPKSHLRPPAVEEDNSFTVGPAKAARNPQMDFIEKAMTRQEGHNWPWEKLPKSIQRHIVDKGISPLTWGEMTPDQRKPFLADIKVSALVATADVWDQVFNGLKMISPAVLAVGAFELLTAYEVLKKAAERLANPYSPGQYYNRSNSYIASQGLVKSAFFLSEEGTEDSGMPADAIPFDQVVAFLKTVTPIVLTHAMTTKDSTVLNGLSRLAVALREAATQTRISREMDPRDYDPKDSDHSYLSGGTAEENLFEA